MGPRGESIGRHMVAAVRGTVNGLVFVGLGEGVLLGAAYVLAGLPHPASAAVATGVLAVIPFGAPLAFGIAALYLAAAEKVLAAVLVFGFGLLVVFVADHLVRPILIGGAARLPFLWVLLGILGGLENFGFLGLFLGPMVDGGADLAVARMDLDCGGGERQDRGVEALARAKKPAVGQCRHGFLL